MKKHPQATLAQHDPTDRCGGAHKTEHSQKPLETTSVRTRDTLETTSANTRPLWLFFWAGNVGAFSENTRNHLGQDSGHTRNHLGQHWPLVAFLLGGKYGGILGKHSKPPRSGLGTHSKPPRPTLAPCGFSSGREIWGHSRKTLETTSAKTRDTLETTSANTGPLWLFFWAGNVGAFSENTRNHLGQDSGHTRNHLGQHSPLVAFLLGGKYGGILGKHSKPPRSGLGTHSKPPRPTLAPCGFSSGREIWGHSRKTLETTSAKTRDTLETTSANTGPLWLFFWAGNVGAFSENTRNHAPIHFTPRPQRSAPILTPLPCPCGCGLWLFLWAGNVCPCLCIAP